jgi:hypothetical protein
MVPLLAEIFNDDATEDQDGKPFAFSRLAQCVTIGEDNEDLLLVDPSDQHSVWCFHPGDGGCRAVGRFARHLVGAS